MENDWTYALKVGCWLVAIIIATEVVCLLVMFVGSNWPQ